MDKATARKALIAQRLNLPDRLQRAELLQRVLRIWLVGRPDRVIGAYWPIKGEFDPLPALYRWQEYAQLASLGDNQDAGQAEPAMVTASLAQHQRRKIGLPVVEKVNKTLSFHAWYPCCPMEEDAYGIPKPKDTEQVAPSLLLVPCVGWGPGGYRLGYGGGFYDRTLSSIAPPPVTVGLGYSMGWLPELLPEAHDVPLDAILSDEGVAWQK
jgi:5-formyltetrahydrofolate cyclo-ligase